MKNIKESELYPIVKKWLDKTQLCFKVKINKGLRKYSIIDVIGVKDVGGDLSGEIETIAIEVKRGTEPFAKASGQALANKVYANRIYLADLRDESFNRDEIYIASYLGIGLIHIQKKGCREVLSSPYYKPIEKLNLLLLEKLNLGKCQLCDSFFEISDIDTSYSKTTSENLKKAIHDEKGLRFWNREVANRKKRLGVRDVSEEIQSYERRFICPDCVKYLLSQFNTD